MPASAACFHKAIVVCFPSLTTCPSCIKVETLSRFFLPLPLLKPACRTHHCASPVMRVARQSNVRLSVCAPLKWGSGQTPGRPQPWEPPADDRTNKPIRGLPAWGQLANPAFSSWRLIAAVCERRL
ncbi:hypothetical protein ABBQ32_007260 [Trebouxia sp. C0010 RCD-2024]